MGRAPRRSRLNKDPAMNQAEPARRSLPARYAHRAALLAVFGVWVIFAWPGLSLQFATLDYWRQRLAGRSLEERAAIVDYPAYSVARQVEEVVPPAACILFLAYTGPEHVNYYKTRFDYYLYPRRVRIAANTDAQAKNCGYLAVFRDAPANLAEEPFRGVWDEGRLQHRLASLEKVYSGPNLDIYHIRR